MKSRFLEDLISTGSAIWEQYLSPTLGKDTEPLPAPVWDQVPAAEAFRQAYAYDFDWRVWLVMTTAVSCVISARAQDEPCRKDGRCLHGATKYAQLNFIHAAEDCPGGHQEQWDWIATALRGVPDMEMPSFSPALDKGRHQFRVAAWYEWQGMRGSFVPEWELEEDDYQYHSDMATLIESDMFRETDIHALYGIALFATHAVRLRLEKLGIHERRAARAILCIQTQAMFEIAELRMRQQAISQSLRAMFGGVDAKTTTHDPHRFYSPKDLN